MKLSSTLRAALVLPGAMAFGVSLGVVAFVGLADAAGRPLTGYALVQPGVTSSLVPVRITTTAPLDRTILTREGTIHATSATKAYKYIGQTPVGGPQKDATLQRITVRSIPDGEEVTFKGTYTPGDPTSITASTIYQHNRSFVVCGKFQTFQRKISATAGSDEFTVDLSKATVQESRYQRYFPAGKDVLFTFTDTTKIHHANGSWKAPKNRVSADLSDLRANQEGISVRGKITNTNTIEASTVDIGVKCN